MPGYLRYIIIFVLGSLLFCLFLGQVHLFDWDEINFAECAREMIVSKDYLRAQIDFLPFWEKPPLFIWMQVLAMKMFGINAYAARFPNALIGVATLMTIFYAGKRIIGERMATWWVLLYAATWLPHFYFKSGIIDPTFNFFIFTAFFQIYLVKHGGKKILHAALSGLFLGLAVLTKGPVAILVSVLSLVVYFIVNKGFWGYKSKYLVIILLSTCVPVALWLGSAVVAYGADYGSWFTHEFVKYQVRLFSTEDADHGGPFFYHFIVLLVGCFPASAFLFQYSRKRITGSEPARDFTKWMWILFWVVLILFSIVKTKIVHYSSLCYFPLTYLAALQIDRIAAGQANMKKGVKAVLLTLGTILGIVITALPLVGLNKNKLIPYIDDPFAVANLSANVSWSYAECIWGLLYLAGIWAAAILMNKDMRKGIITLCIVQIVIIQVTVLHFTPKIEAISQRSAINYFKDFQGKDVYIHTLGYKSYAYLFYAQKMPGTNKNYYNENWLLNGPVDKPTYFISKITGADKYRSMPQLQEIGGSNGFVFFKRK